MPFRVKVQYRGFLEKISANLLAQNSRGLLKTLTEQRKKKGRIIFSHNQLSADIYRNYEKPKNVLHIQTFLIFLNDVQKKLDTLMVYSLI